MIFIYFKGGFYLKNTRHAIILDELNKKSEIRINELIALLPTVSEMTIRRDLDFLANKGCLLRTHGGAKHISAISNSPYDFQTRLMLNQACKSVIANQALSFIDDECSIFFDSGSTTLELAKIISNKKIHAITSAPNISMELLKNPDIQVILLGGVLNKSTVSVTGPMPLNYLDQLNIDIAFISASGFSLSNGFTNAYFDECNLKQKVISMAKHVVILLDISKINRVLPFTFATLKDIHTIVLNEKPDPDILEVLQKSDVRILFPK